MRLENETAFITGADSGLGRSAAELFADEGATIVAADIDQDGAKTTVENIERDGGFSCA